jgi:hypothetical protein
MCTMLKFVGVHDKLGRSGETKKIMTLHNFFHEKGRRTCVSMIYRRRNIAQGYVEIS